MCFSLCRWNIGASSIAHTNFAKVPYFLFETQMKNSSTANIWDFIQVITRNLRLQISSIQNLILDSDARSLGIGWKSQQWLPGPRIWEHLRCCMPFPDLITYSTPALVKEGEDFAWELHGGVQCSELLICVVPDPKPTHSLWWVCCAVGNCHNGIR